MKILDDILSTLDFAAGVRDIRQGNFQTAVVTRHGGLAATLSDPGPHQEVPPVKAAGALLEKSTLELARMAYSATLLEAAIGMAAINSLIEIDEARCAPLNGRDLLAERGKGKRVAVVGHFPFVSQLRSIFRELWVIEKQPRPGDVPEVETERWLPEADVVGITGTAMTNHTIEDLLRLCRPDAFVVLLGGTAPLSPALFTHGVDAISGARVVDAGAVLLGVSQGATYRQLKGVQRLTLVR